MLLSQMLKSSKIFRATHPQRCTDEGETGVEKSTFDPLIHAKFTTISAMCCTYGANNVKITL